MARKLIEFEGYPEELALVAPFGPFRAITAGVTDGDTISVLVDGGFGLYASESIRISGINTPELSSGPAEERERARRARDYLARVLPRGTPVVLRTYRDRKTFDRYVADVAVMRRGKLVDVGTLMVEKGYAERVKA